MRGLSDIPRATGNDNRAMLGLAGCAILVWRMRQVEEMIHAAAQHCNQLQELWALGWPIECGMQFFIEGAPRSAIIHLIQLLKDT